MMERERSSKARSMYEGEDHHEREKPPECLLCVPSCFSDYNCFASCMVSSPKLYSLQEQSQLSVPGGFAG